MTVTKINALEVHPTEIAFDIASGQRTIAAIDGHRRFGFNFDPSHLDYQGVDYVKFIRRFQGRIHNAHMKSVWWGKGDGDGDGDYPRVEDGARFIERTVASAASQDKWTAW